MLASVDEALAAGRIGVEHARVLVDAANPRIEPLIADLQDELIDRATEISFDRWRREVLAIVALLDQDGGHDPERDRSRTRASVARLFDGTTRILIDLLGTDAALVTAALDSEADRLFHRYRSDHRIDPVLTIPSRATLLALALVELCRKGLARDVGASEPPRPEVILTIPIDDPNTARFLDGTTIHISELDTILHDPYWRPAFLDATSGAVLDLGRTHRYANREQRRALALRDGGCVFPGCDVVAAWCDSHHVTGWELGGCSDMANLALVCRHHHNVTHRHGWTMTARPDQTFTWTTPTGATIASQRHGQRAGP